MSSADAPKKLAVSEILTLFDSSAEARAALKPEMNRKVYLDTLLANKLFPDAIHFMAHALPKREAIWWGCLCCRDFYGEKITPAEKGAVGSAVRWVMDPTDENRRATQETSKVAGTNQPAGMVALATFFSGGSIAPVGQHEAPAPESLTGILVGNAVMIAAITKAPAEPPDPECQKFIQWAIEVASGQNRWKEK